MNAEFGTPEHITPNEGKWHTTHNEGMPWAEGDDQATENSEAAFDELDVRKAVLKAGEADMKAAQDAEVASGNIPRSVGVSGVEKDAEPDEEKKLSLAGKAVRLGAAAVIIGGSSQVAACAPKVELSNGRQGNEHFANIPEAQQVQEMVKGEHFRFEVLAAGAEVPWTESKNEPHPRSFDGLLKDAGWNQGESDAFLLALRQLNPGLKIEKDNFQPENYDTPVSATSKYHMAKPQ